MNTSVTTVKQSVSFRWNSDLVKSLKEMAKRQNRSFSNFTETILQRALDSSNKVYDVLNAQTKAAIEYARSGKELETLDLDHFDEYVKNL